MIDPMKRRSECTPEELDEADYEWLRKNYSWERQGLHKAFEGMFRHIDRLLGVKPPVEPTL